MRMRRKEWMDKELENSSFYLENATQYKGGWAKMFVKDQPIWMELGVGKGGFIAELGHLHPEINFLGIDITTAVLASAHRAVKDVYKDQPVDNIRLVAWDVSRLPDLMDKNDMVRRIYINFCNPWPKDRHKKRRLTHPKQLELYKAVLAEGGEICFKTDDDDLFADTLEYFAQDNEFTVSEIIYDLAARPDIESPATEHQLMFTAKGIPTKYLRAVYFPAKNTENNV